MGSGKPLLLIHGLGGSARSWSTIWTALAERRGLIAADLPGFGDTPPLAGETSISSLSDAVTSLIDAQGLRGIDISSYSQAKLNAVAGQLTERQRETLGYQTPAEMFSHTVALTG